MEENIKIALERQNRWWFDKKFETGIERLPYYEQVLKFLNTPEVLLLIGARGIGKSTLLHQIVKRLLSKEDKKSILFINLDEPLFQAKADDPAFLVNLIREYLSANDNKKIYVFIDEIQNNEKWVSTIKTLYDTEKRIKLILTGSSSTLLHSAATTKLSGRCFHTIVSPLSFEEYLAFQGVEDSTVLERKKHFETYLKYGAFPRVVLEKDEMLKQELLKNYFQTIYLKDIIYPHNLRNNRDVFELLYYVISNVGRPFSYTSISKVLNISIDTIKEYLRCAEESYLISSITKYEHSVKKQMANAKKIYCLDTGLVNAVSFKFSENKGWLLENLAYFNILKSGGEVYYHKDRFECDFIVKKGLKVVSAVQVSVSLKDDDTRKREIQGLLEAMHKYKIKESLIITESEQDELTIDGKKIHVKPFYEWVA